MRTTGQGSVSSVLFFTIQICNRVARVAERWQKILLVATAKKPYFIRVFDTSVARVAVIFNSICKS